MVLYQYINVEHIPQPAAEQLIKKSNCNVENVRKNYKKVEEVLSNYDF